MKAFEEAYQEAIKENGCNGGETFARSMFRVGADNLIDQASANGQKKYHQGMDFMKSKAIDAFKESCPCWSKFQQDRKCNECTYLKDFCNQLD